MQIREMLLEDVPGLAAIRRELFPWMVASVAAQENWFTATSPAARAQRWVAETEGTITGFGSAMLNTATKEPNAGMGQVCVRPAHQGTGVGGAIWERVTGHLQDIEVHRAVGWGLEVPEVKAWLGKRGVQSGAVSRYAVVDPRHLPPLPELASDVTIESAAQAGPGAVFEIEKIAAADVPGDMVIDGITKADWLARLWNGPDYSREASMVAFVSGVPAAFTNLEINSATGRAWTSGTGTLRGFRGRGLAKAVKSVALRKAAELGVTQCYTANDFNNAPMIAVNNWLGYEFAGKAVSYVFSLR